MPSITHQPAPRSAWLDTIEHRIGARDLLTVTELSDAMMVCRRYILDCIEDGRLRAINLNHGTNKVPFYRIARADALALAKRIQQGQ